MTSRLGVMTASGDYATAIGELPRRTRPTDDLSGAIVIVPGDAHWGAVARDAAAAGAVGIVVERPAPLPSAEIDALIDQLPTGLPVVLERPFLRPDSAADAVSARTVDGARVAPRLVTVDCAATDDQFAAAVRDAIGWLRLLCGGALGRCTGTLGSALFEARDADGPPAAMTAVQAAGTSRLRVDALGELRSHLEITATRATISTSTDQGRLIAPARFESPQRLALRRALEALETAEKCTDLADFAADSLLAGGLSMPGGHKYR